MTNNWSINFHYALGTVSLVSMGNGTARRVNFLQSSLASRISRLMSRSKNSETWQKNCARWWIGMAYGWKPLDVMTYYVLKIPYPPRSEERMSMISVSHVPMVISIIIWYQIGLIQMVPLTIEKLLQTLQFLLIPQVSSIQTGRDSPSRSWHKA